MKGEHCGEEGSVAVSKVSAGPWSPLGEDRKVGMRRPPSEQQGANLRAERVREETEGGEPKGRPGTHAAKAGEVGHRRVASGAQNGNLGAEDVEELRGWENHRK